MPFKISISSGHPNYETLPAAKIISYPLAKEDYRPFAQARLLLGREGLYLQMIAFEVTVSPLSRLSSSFSLEKKGNLWISLTAGETGIDVFSAWQGDKLLWQENNAVSLAPIHGEDLQGVYWGFQALLPYETLLRLWPNFTFHAGESIHGNLFKTCSDPQWEHYGSFFPADFTAENPYGPKNFGEFQLVSY